jgi:CHAT domain-containing protein
VLRRSAGDDRYLDLSCGTAPAEGLRRPATITSANGRHEAQNALFSSLDLAGGPILGYDRQRLVRPPRLVVPAGCELALRVVRPGDESFGMASGLLATGTATVVASVSRVADDAASEAIIALHRELAAGCTSAEALASAAGTGFICLGS